MFKAGDKIMVKQLCSGCEPGKVYTVGGGGTNLIDGGCGCYDTNWVLYQEGSQLTKGGSNMVYQVVVENVTLVTASVAEKREIVLAPQTIEAYDSNEAVLKVGIEHAKELSVKADRLVVTVKGF